MSSITALLTRYIKDNEVCLLGHEEKMRNTSASMKNSENQIAQIAKTISKRLPSSIYSNTKVNPKESLKAITLRNGRERSSPTLKETEIKGFNPQPRAEQSMQHSPNTKVDSGKKQWRKKILNYLSINPNSPISIKLKRIKKRSNTRNS